jgi:homoserine dehydrogenase
LALVGFGVVGKALTELLRSKREELEALHKFKAEVTLIASQNHGTALNPDGLNLDEIAETASAGRDLGPVSGDSLECFLRRSRADVMIEATPTTRDGEVGLRHIRTALEMGLHVVTANKGPIALAYEELTALASKKGLYLLFEGTVQGGTPLFAMIREGLAGCSFTGAQGVLNASTNVILTAMESGKSYEEALGEAREAGLVGEDPSMDVEGWDAALKTLILAKVLFGAPLRLMDVERKGIGQVTPKMIGEARARNSRIKLLAELKRDGEKIRASVRPAWLPVSNPLSLLDGAENMVMIDTDNLGTVSIRGSGGGGLQTAQGALSDLLSIARRRNFEV